MSKVFNQFDIKDIQEFLDNHGILWDGEYFPSSDDWIESEVELKKGSNYVDAQLLIALDDISFCCVITTFPTRSSSESITKDFSKDWVKYIISKYPQKANHIKELLEANIKLTHENANKEIEALERQIGEIRKNEETNCSYLNQILKIAKKSATPNNHQSTDNERAF